MDGKKEFADMIMSKLKQEAPLELISKIKLDIEEVRNDIKEVRETITLERVSTAQLIREMREAINNLRKDNRELRERIKRVEQENMELRKRIEVIEERVLKVFPELDR